jgi:DNA invertase Pin-like site-specific DNA recombinase
MSSSARSRKPSTLGDALIVTHIDRLARSIRGLQDIVRVIRARGATLKATEHPIDTSTAAGKCFLDLLDVFAEFETNLRRERLLEGIAKAKAAGVYKGRPASIDGARVRKLKAGGMGATQIAKGLKIGRASIYRVLGGDFVGGVLRISLRPRLDPIRALSGRLPFRVSLQKVRDVDLA